MGIADTVYVPHGKAERTDIRASGPYGEESLPVRCTLNIRYTTHIHAHTAWSVLSTLQALKLHFMATSDPTDISSAYM